MRTRWLAGVVLVLGVGMADAAAQATGRAEDGSIDNLRHPPGTVTAEAGSLGEVVRRGTGPIHLVLLPGAPFGADVWSAFMERNAGRYTMWAVTQPGYGSTQPPAMPSWSEPERTEWLDGVQGALIRMMDEEGIERPFVVAHHLEADYHGLRLALEHPDRVAGVVVMAGGPGRAVSLTDSTGRRRAARPAERVDAVKEQWIPFYGSVTPDAWRQGTYQAPGLSVDSARGAELFDRQVAVPIPTQIRYFVELLTTDLRPRLSDLAVPLLVVSPRPVASLGEHFDQGTQRILALPEFAGMDAEQGRRAYVESRIERFGDEEAALRAIYASAWLEMEGSPPHMDVEVVGPAGVFVFDDRPRDVDRILETWIAGVTRGARQAASFSSVRVVAGVSGSKGRFFRDAEQEVSGYPLGRTAR